MSDNTKSQIANRQSLEFRVKQTANRQSFASMAASRIFHLGFERGALVVKDSMPHEELRVVLLQLCEVDGFVV